MKAVVVCQVGGSLQQIIEGLSWACFDTYLAVCDERAVERVGDPNITLFIIGSQPSHRCKVSGENLICRLRAAGCEKSIIGLADTDDRWEMMKIAGADSRLTPGDDLVEQLRAVFCD